MITVAIKTEPQEVRQFSQIPILAWGVERVYQRNRDKELLEQCLGRLERFHDWYWRERDLHDNGLITLGAYTGNLQHARWETFDYECNMDDMKMTVHPVRKGPGEGPWYADICVPGNTAYLIMGERSLARLAEIVGDTAMAARRRKRIEKGIAAMRQHMWDDKAGAFLSVRRDSLEKIPVATIGSWIPLAAGVPTAARRNAWPKCWPRPPGRRRCPCPPWTAPTRAGNPTPSGAAMSGRPPTIRSPPASPPTATADLAADIADKTVANAIKNGISEHYNSVTGKALGVADYCMSCTLVTMMLDGLTREHRLGLKTERGL